MNFCLGTYIYAPGWLVQNQNLRIVNQSLRQANSALEPLR